MPSNRRTIDDFDDWTNWLLYRGGVGVKADDSWETWWEEEHVRISFMTFPTYSLKTTSFQIRENT